MVLSFKSHSGWRDWIQIPVGIYEAMCKPDLMLVGAGGV